jgi:hypothetical protein
MLIQLVKIICERCTHLDVSSEQLVYSFIATYFFTRKTGISSTEKICINTEYNKSIAKLNLIAYINSCSYINFNCSRLAGKYFPVLSKHQFG